MTGRTAQRVLFHGVTGSGKSSAAQAYSTATGVPAFSADEDLGWLPVWTNRPMQDQNRIAADIADLDGWVLDSGYSSWRDIIMRRTQLVVFLDYPRWLSLARLVRRTVRRITRRESVCNGNVETLRRALSRNSIILWHFRSFAGKRREIEDILADPSMPPVATFRRPRELTAWLRAGAPMPGSEPGRPMD